MTRKIGLFLICAFYLAACAPSKEETATPTDTTVDPLTMEISKLSGTSGLLLSLEKIDFGTTDQSTRKQTKILTIKNTSARSINMDIVPLATNTGFSIFKNQQCSKTLAANSSCSLTILFNNQGLYDAKYHDGVIVNSGSSSYAVQFEAEVTGNNFNGSNNGVDKLLLTLDSPFNLRGNTYRNLSVSNVGTATSNSLSEQLPDGYKVRLNRCSTLMLESQSCSMQIVYDAVLTEPPGGSATIASTSNSTSINLLTGVSNFINNDNIFTNLFAYPLLINYQSGFSLIHYQKPVNYIKKGNFKMVLQGE